MPPSPEKSPQYRAALAERKEEIEAAKETIRLREVYLYGRGPLVIRPLPQTHAQHQQLYRVRQKMRKRLPERRDVEITTLRLQRADGHEVQFEAAVGFDSQRRPKEVFLSGAKAGSDMAVVLADTAVAISVALQHGVKAKEMAQSIARIPTEIDGPAVAPASVIGATLELLASYEKEGDQK